MATARNHCNDVNHNGSIIYKASAIYGAPSFLEHSRQEPNVKIELKDVNMVGFTALSTVFTISRTASNNMIESRPCLKIMKKAIKNINNSYNLHNKPDESENDDIFSSFYILNRAYENLPTNYKVE